MSYVSKFVSFRKRKMKEKGLKHGNSQRDKGWKGMKDETVVH